MRTGVVLAALAVLSSAAAASGAPAQNGSQLTFALRGRSGSEPAVVCGLKGGAAPVRLLAAEGRIADFAWTRDGARAALVRATGEPPVLSLNVTAPAGPGRRIAVGASQPAWSLDGRRIAYIVEGWLYVARSDGTRKRRLLKPRGMASWAAPRWSRDGRRIYIFDAWYGPVRWWLHSVRPDGTGLRTIKTSWRYYAESSPDRRRIAYADTGHLYVANADGRGARRIAEAGSRQVGALAWSPDGQMIAFVRRSWGGSATGDVFAIRPDGTGERQVTNTPYDEFSPGWRASGTWPAFGPCVPPGS